MGVLANVKLQRLSDTPYRCLVLVNGVPLNGVQAVDFHVDPESCPKTVLTLASMVPEFDGTSEIDLRFSENAVEQAKKVLDTEITNDRALRMKFRKVIEQTLEAHNCSGLPFEDNADMAEYILQALLGI